MLKIKKTKTKTKKRLKEQPKQDREFLDLEDKQIFKYEKKKYIKVEDFIKYLNEHYKDIDKIAKIVLDDEDFYGWVSEKSGVFHESLQKFKEIKENIEE